MITFQFQLPTSLNVDINFSILKSAISIIQHKQCKNTFQFNLYFCSFFLQLQKQQLIQFTLYFHHQKFNMFTFSKIAKSAVFSMTNSLALSRYYFGIIKFNLPDLGEKIKEGTIKKLYIKEGDPVEQFQKLADVASDKQFTEITASNSGVIRKIYYKEEDICQVGDLFLQIFTKEENQVPTITSDTPAHSVNDVKATQSIEIPKIISTNPSEILATPYVRGLIKKFRLDITKIRGSGEGGRILQSDVQNILNQSEDVPTSEVKATVHKYQFKEEEYISSKQVTPPPQHVKQVSSPKITSPPNVPAPQRVAPIVYPTQVQNVSMSPFERGMQKSMTESNTIPHLYLHQEFDITEVEKMRKSLKQSNKKVTVMGILIKTFSLALKQYPRMNSLYNPTSNPYEFTIHPNHNISIAIDSPNGLVVPHIKNVQRLNLGDIQGELQRLRNLAKEAKLTGKQLQGGTICLSNIGTIGGTHACPLILPPQVCIVAIGKLQSVPKYRNGELTQRKVINISYGCDHRIVDGATVARFSNCWKQLIENPYLSIAEMI